MHRVAVSGCPYCGSSDIRFSRPRNRWEEVANLLLLRPGRCHSCLRRCYRPAFIPRLPFLTKAVARKKPNHQVDANQPDEDRFVS